MFFANARENVLFDAVDLAYFDTNGSYSSVSHDEKERLQR